MRPTKKVYLRNADMLIEIEKSKNSYSYFVDQKYENYDIIAEDLTTVTQELIDDAKVRRVEARIKAVKKGKATAADETPPNDDEIVIKRYTYEHIPLDHARTRKIKVEKDKYVKLKFIPFKHYVRKDGEFVEVGRSHWFGGFDNGHFVLDQGQITNDLAIMFMLLVERYAQKGRWRGYSYNDEMQCHALLQLSEIALKFNESKSNNPFAYFTQSIKNAFFQYLNTERKHQAIKDDLLMMNGIPPSYSKQLEYEENERKKLLIPIAKLEGSDEDIDVDASIDVELDSEVENIEIPDEDEMELEELDD